MTKVRRLARAAFLGLCWALLVTAVPAAAANGGRLVIHTSHAQSWATVPALVEAFRQEYPEIEVEYLHSAREQLATMVAGGVSPDVAEVRSEDYLLGILQPLDDYLARSEVVRKLREEGGLPAFLFDAGLSNGLFAGHYYFMHTMRFYPSLATIFNVTMFQEAGLVPFSDDRAPSWDEVAEAHRRLTRLSAEGLPEQIGFDIRNLVRVPIRIAYPFGVDFVDVENNRATLVNLLEPITFLYDNFVRTVGVQDIRQLDRLLSSHIPAFSSKRSAGTFANAPTPPRVRESGLMDEIRTTWTPSTTGERIHFLDGHPLGLIVGAQNLENAYRFLDFTITYLDWHREVTFPQFAAAGANALADLIENPARWWPTPPEQSIEWFFTSLAHTDRFVSPTNHGTWWEDGVVADWWFRRDMVGLTRSFSGQEPIIQVLEEVDRFVNADIQRGP